MRIAMYWHNGRSLGHTAEVAKISSALANDMPESYFSGISGAFKGLDMLPDKVDVFKLPSYTNYDNEDSWNYTGKQGLPISELFKLRSKLICTYMSSYKPDIFLVNHIPNGLYDELVPTLNLRRPGLRVLTLRGILFDREKTEREYFRGSTAKLVMDHYDCIIVHIDPIVFSIEENYWIPAELKNRLKYLGYLTPPCSLTQNCAKKQLGIENNGRIVVASMGGGQGAMSIWEKILASLTVNKHQFDECYFITGPYLEHEHKAAL